MSKNQRPSYEFMNAVLAEQTFLLEGICDDDDGWKIVRGHEKRAYQAGKRDARRELIPRVQELTEALQEACNQLRSSHEDSYNYTDINGVEWTFCDIWEALIRGENPPPGMGTKEELPDG